jgi:hypothetical protein
MDANPPVRLNLATTRLQRYDDHMIGKNFDPIELTLDDSGALHSTSMSLTGSRRR